MGYKDDILERIRRLELPQKEYVVVGSGALAVRDIRPAGDIDLIVTPQLFEVLKSRGWEELQWDKPGMEGKIWLKNDQAEAVTEMFSGLRKDITVSDLLSMNEVEAIEGIYFLSLPILAHFKKEYGREKDLADVRLIESYLQTIT